VKLQCQYRLENIQVMLISQSSVMESNSLTMQAWMSTLYSLTMAQKKPQEQSPMEKNGTLILKRLVYNTLAEQLQTEQ
jgi:hypothetical protein